MAYVSLSDIKAHLAIASVDTSEDALLTAYLSASEGRINSHCGRSFESSSSTRHYGRDAVVGSMLRLDSDLISITSLTNGDGEVFQSSDYMLWPLNTSPVQAIYLSHAFEWRFSSSTSTIQVDGSWGYSATPPAEVVQACKEYVHFLYHAPDHLRKNAKQQHVGALPGHITQLLAPFVRRV